MRKIRVTVPPLGPIPPAPNKLQVAPRSTSIEVKLRKQRFIVPMRKQFPSPTTDQNYKVLSHKVLARYFSYRNKPRFPRLGRPNKITYKRIAFAAREKKKTMKSINLGGKTFWYWARAPKFKFKKYKKPDRNLLWYQPKPKTYKKPRLEFWHWDAWIIRENKKHRLQWPIKRLTSRAFAKRRSVLQKLKWTNSQLRLHKRITLSSIRKRIKRALVLKRMPKCTYRWFQQRKKAKTQFVRAQIYRRWALASQTNPLKKPALVFNRRKLPSQRYSALFFMRFGLITPQWFIRSGRPTLLLKRELFLFQNCNVMGAHKWRIRWNYNWRWQRAAQTYLNWVKRKKLRLRGYRYHPITQFRRRLQELKWWKWVFHQARARMVKNNWWEQMRKVFNYRRRLIVNQVLSFYKNLNSRVTTYLTLFPTLWNFMAVSNLPFLTPFSHYRRFIDNSLRRRAQGWNILLMLGSKRNRTLPEKKELKEVGLSIIKKRQPRYYFYPEIPLERRRFQQKLKSEFLLLKSAFKPRKTKLLRRNNQIGWPTSYNSGIISPSAESIKINWVTWSFLLKKTNSYLKAKTRYHQRRRKLLRRLKSLQKSKIQTKAAKSARLRLAQFIRKRKFNRFFFKNQKMANRRLTIRKLRRPHTLSAETLNLMVNFTRSNYYLTLAKAKNGNVIKTFSAGNLKIKTARKKRLTYTLYALLSEAGKYLKLIRTNRLGKLILDYPQYSRRTGVEISNVSKITGVLRKAKVRWRRLIQQPRRPHGLPVRACVLRRK